MEWFTFSFPDRESTDRLFVVAGEHDLDVDSGNEQQKFVASYVVHEHYDRNTFTNDIALVKLSTPLTLNTVVQAITLPAQEAFVAPGTNCTTTGWGSTLEGGAISPILRKVCKPPILNYQPY